ncbi:MAG: hypothetical protein HKN23_07545 [Verrucomicrobiales bacterium]|nr:hypothetical protein [Verrucomicrobiales bacterium]
MTLVNSPQPTVMRWLNVAILVVSSILILGIWAASWSYSFVWAKNHSFRSSKNLGLALVVGRNRIVIGVATIRFSESPPSINHLMPKACNHSWGLDTAPGRWFIVFPIPILLVIPASIWLFCRSGNSRENE